MSVGAYIAGEEGPCAVGRTKRPNCAVPIAVADGTKQVGCTCGWRGYGPVFPAYFSFELPFGPIAVADKKPDSTVDRITGIDIRDNSIEISADINTRGIPPCVWYDFTAKGMEKVKAVLS